MIGTHFGRYYIQSEIGRGGMGIVYRARDIKLERTVAIKVLGEELRARHDCWGYVLREARIISVLNHPSICTIYDAGEENGQPYIAMEYIEGCLLNGLAMPSGLSPRVMAHAARRIASALAHAHERGVIHRDIKGSNIVVTHQGDIKVLDFGLAKLIRPTPGRANSASQNSWLGEGRLAGTMHYLAPEVLRGERASVWTDIWSFGVLLYEMATGELPFGGKTIFDLATAIMISEPKPPRKKIPAWVAHAIARCLERDVARRYHCMREILRDLPTEGVAECVDMALEVDRFRKESANTAERKAATSHAELSELELSAVSVDDPDSALG